MNLDDRIKYIDFHTHQNSATSESVTVQNLMAGEDVPKDFPANTLFSAGIHPWNIRTGLSDEIKTGLILTAGHPHVVFIGEGGYDMLRGPSPDVQHEAFIFQVTLSEEMQKPLIIHCVRAWDRLRAVKKGIKPSMSWIIHGFRGNSGLAESLAKEGFWFSLGLMGITKEVLQVIPGDRLFLETDDTGRPVTEVYRRFSEISGLTEEETSRVVRRNFNNLFINS